VKTLEDVFDKLKNEGMDDAAVEAAQQRFKTQQITYKVLMRRGELAFDDYDLIHIGIYSLGMRRAILAIIKDN
jgi:hypothetical protein